MNLGHLLVSLLFLLAVVSGEEEMQAFVPAGQLAQQCSQLADCAAESELAAAPDAKKDDDQVDIEDLAHARTDQHDCATCPQRDDCEIKPPDLVQIQPELGVKATMYRKMPDKKVQCLACKRKCVISPGSMGYCSVRQNRNGELYSLVYGKVAALQLDPVEKKPLNHFRPGEGILSLSTVGCNFHCRFCQNYNLAQAVRMLKNSLSEKNELTELEDKITQFGRSLTPDQIVDLAEKHSVRNIAFTYNEPTVFVEYMHDIAQRAKERHSDFRTVLVTNGYQSNETLAYLSGLIDAMNIDLKGPQKFYDSTLGGARASGVKQTIELARELGIWVEVTTLLVPGANDAEEDLKDTADFLRGVSEDLPWHITAYHPDYLYDAAPATEASSLLRALRIGKQAGLRHVYVGNVQDRDHSSTFCPQCGAMLVARVGYQVQRFALDANGACSVCGQAIAGVWD